MTIKSDHYNAVKANTLAEARRFAAKITRKHPKINKAKTGYIIIYDK